MFGLKTFVRVQLFGEGPSCLRTTSATLGEYDQSDDGDNCGAHGDYGYPGDHN